jgi:hypothetical protein
MGNIKTTPEEIARARFKKLAKRSLRKQKKSQPNKSVRAVSGGLPSLGKRT